MPGHAVSATGMSLLEHAIGHTLNKIGVRAL